MTFSISVWRQDQEHNPNGPHDPEVTSGRTTIDTVAPTSTDADVEENVKRAFVLKHGQGSVTESNEPMTYIYVWDEENQIWTIRCVTVNLLTVNDGSPKSLYVEIKITA